MPAPTGWLSYLPLSTPADIRERLQTPETALHASAAPDTAIGVTVASNVFTSGIEHGLKNWNAVQFGSTLTLPAPLVANTTYYVRDITSDFAFKVALVIGGAAVTITTAGTGQVSVRNWELNGALVKKITLGDQYIYDVLLAKVMDHIRPWSMNTWYGYFPVGYGQVTVTTPRDRAALILDNLVNPTQLLWASCDTAIWQMCEDGALRNEVFDSSFEQYRGQSLAKRKQQLADESIAQNARLLMVDTASGAFSLFNFEQVTDSVTVSLL